MKALSSLRSDLEALRLTPRQELAADDAMVAGLRRRLETVTAQVVPRDEPVALLDFPNHGNVGDSLIWLGERRLFDAMGYAVRYHCDNVAYNAAALRRALGRSGGTILVHGGGNFGDIWPEWQRFRERVAIEHPDRRIVQLPQTIHFKGDPGLERARAAFGAHPDVHLLVRDEPSLKLATESLELPATLCPDMAFAIGPLARTAEPDLDAVVMGRIDTERERAGVDGIEIASMLRSDWTADHRDQLGWEKRYDLVQYRSRRLGRRFARREAFAVATQPALRLTYEWLAHDRARFGRDLLSRGRVLGTDRLHGHVLATLMGIPHVVVDSGYGKLTRFHEAWTADSKLATFAAPDDAQGVVEQLLKS